MKKVILGLMVTAALTGVALPAHANETVQEVTVQENTAVIREYALKQLVVQRTYLNGLIEKQLLTAEQGKLMLDALQQQETYIQSDYFDPRNMFGLSSGMMMPGMGQVGSEEHDHANGGDMGRNHSAQGMMGNGMMSDGMMSKGMMGEGMMGTDMMANGSCSMMQQKPTAGAEPDAPVETLSEAPAHEESAGPADASGAEAHSHNH